MGNSQTERTAWGMELGHDPPETEGTALKGAGLDSIF